MYLYGEFVPSKHVQSRTFGDVWQLSIDMPGGYFSEADLERDVRSPKMGPWARRFTCGSVSNTWRKCGGSCGGKYVFCSTECLKEGWKEHKQKHGCRKILSRNPCRLQVPPGTLGRSKHVTCNVYQQGTKFCRVRLLDAK
ncbi:hypothetical protein BKA93DRAFT_323837 [Sparassis latifolia]